MSEKEFYASGFIAPTPYYPTFVEPTVQTLRSEPHCVQVVEDGIVSSLRPIEKSSSFVEIIKPVSAKSGIGATPLFAFALSESEVKFGNAKDVALELLVVRDELRRSPHLLAEVADFFQESFSSKWDSSEEPSTLERVISYSKRKARERIFGFPSAGNALRSLDLYFASQPSARHYDVLSRFSPESCELRVWTIPTLLKWAREAGPDRHYSLLNLAISDQLSTSYGAIMIGRPEAGAARQLWHTILTGADKRNVLRASFRSDIEFFRDFLYWAPRIVRRSYTDADMIAELFDVAGAVLAQTMTVNYPR